jgi:hypothetical protein
VRFVNLAISGFESDNHSTYNLVIEPPGRQVPDVGSTLALLGAGLVTLRLLRRSAVGKPI